MDFTTWFEGIVNNVSDYVYHILGCGAIGSATAIQLARMGATEFLLYDFDRVSVENIGVSHYVYKDIGTAKVDALKAHVLAINSEANVMENDERFSCFEDTGNKSIMILAFDSMDSRKIAVEIALKSRVKPWLLIDGRMGAEHYQQYTFKNPKLADYMKTWYSDESGDSEPCNAKATSYCASMSGSFIANQISKAITHGNIDEEFFFNFPALTLARK